MKKYYILITISFYYSLVDAIYAEKMKLKMAEE